MKDIRNYNREFRKFICKVESLFSSYCELNNINELKDPQSLYLSIFNSIANGGMFNPIVRLLYGLLLMTGYSDSYMMLLTKDKYNTLTNEESIYFKLLKNVKSNDELVKLFNSNQVLASYAISSIVEFNKMSAFDKILRVKRVSDMEKEKIKNINTLYYQDLENYDIEINIELILNQIRKGLNTYPLDKLLMDSSMFLNELKNANESSAKKILSHLIKTNIVVCDYILNYQSSNEKFNDIGIKERAINKLKWFKECDKNTLIKNLRVHQIMELLEFYMYYEDIINDNDLKLPDFYDNKMDAKLKKKLEFIDQETN